VQAIYEVIPGQNSFFVSGEKNFKILLRLINQNYLFTINICYSCIDKRDKGNSGHCDLQQWIFLATEFSICGRQLSAIKSKIFTKEINVQLLLSSIILGSN
jgi:hypothetical protein